MPPTINPSYLLAASSAWVEGFVRWKEKELNELPGK